MPYREGKPLAEIIPPDRRRLQAIALVAVSMIAGGALYALGSVTMDFLADPVKPGPGPVTAASDRLSDATLAGPDGMRPLRTGKLSIVHVWLQACADCMPAFEALRDLQAHGGFGLDVAEVNVSYGRADPAWAERYGVRSNLVWDLGGSAVVKPLGISSFTTLVVDERGYVLHRDRPDRSGYADAIRAVLREHGAHTGTPPPSKRLEKEDVELVVDQHTPAVRACWDRSAPSARSVRLTVRLVVTADGAATQVEVEGGPSELTECVRQDVVAWRFPRPAAPTPLEIPVQLTRR